MEKIFEIYVDGACQGNPGQAGLGVVILEKGKVIREISEYLGTATNNIAEYMALIYALQEALILNIRSIQVFTDSELLCHQVQGDYQVKNPGLKFLYHQVQHLLKGFKKFEIQHIVREKNKHADRLAAQSIKKEQAKMVAPMFDMGEESPSSVG